MAALHGRAAIGADAGRLDRVLTDREPVRSGSLAEPGVQIAVDELDYAVTALADQMVVMLLAAEPVAGLARVMAERIDGAAFAESRERPVHGREPDAFAAAGEDGVDLLRGRVVSLGSEDPEDGDALARRAEAVALEKLGDGRLRGRAHVAYDSL
jgi:hypothetical protein